MRVHRWAYTNSSPVLAREPWGCFLVAGFSSTMRCWLSASRRSTICSSVKDRQENRRLERRRDRVLCARWRARLVVRCKDSWVCVSLTSSHNRHRALQLAGIALPRYRARPDRQRSATMVRQLRRGIRVRAWSSILAGWATSRATRLVLWPRWRCRISSTRSGGSFPAQSAAVWRHHRSGWRRRTGSRIGRHGKSHLFESSAHRKARARVPRGNDYGAIASPGNHQSRFLERCADFNPVGKSVASWRQPSTALCELNALRFLLATARGRERYWLLLHVCLKTRSNSVRGPN